MDLEQQAVLRAFASAASLCASLFVSLFVLLWLIPLSVAATGEVADASGSNDSFTVQHGVSRYGQPRYPASFSHFDYVNPEAPKGGSIRYSGIGSFDSLNRWIDKGTTAMGINGLYDTLLEDSSDEPFSAYGLLAESIELAKDNSWVAFNLRPSARFHDGHPVTAEDIVFTFNLLRQQGRPFYKTYYADVARAEATSQRRVLFVFKHNNNRELAQILGQLPALPKHYWEREDNDFAVTSLKPPVGSGPYKIKAIESGHSITYERDPNYWGRNLAVNIGRYNFDTIIYDYYRDRTVSLQALKTGALDFRIELLSKDWATAYHFEAIKTGKVITESLRTLNPFGMQAFIFNLRRPPFDDIRVRQALNYAFDFEWSNRNLFYSLYARTNSYFVNSDLAASGLPDEQELKLLQPWKEQLPEKLFTQPFTLPQTDGSGNNRENLKAALELLQQAGWHIQDGQLLDEQGKQFSFDLLLLNPSMERIALPIKKNLELLGINMRIRTVDLSHYLSLIRNFDFDITADRFPMSSSPGNELRNLWGSEAADTPGSRNSMGIKNPVVDSLIEKVISADDYQELLAATHALDRVLLWQSYLIPHWYDPYLHVAYKNTLHHPDSAPLFSLDMSIWWYEPPPVATSDQAADTEDTATTEAEDGFRFTVLLVIAGLLLYVVIARRRKKGQ
ncbi:extracellular solute-binding protein [Endozoicomonadaceae bacterium StTr2]